MINLISFITNILSLYQAYLDLLKLVICFSLVMSHFNVGKFLSKFSIEVSYEFIVLQIVGFEQDG
jgi:hypothetical protein